MAKYEIFYQYGRSGWVQYSSGDTIQRDTFELSEVGSIINLVTRQLNGEGFNDIRFDIRAAAPLTW